MDEVHKCDRTKCPTKAQKHKKKCVVCKCDIFLGCYNFHNCGATGVKMHLTNGIAFMFDPMDIQMVCEECGKNQKVDDRMGVYIDEKIEKKPTNANKPVTSDQDAQTEQCSIDTIANDLSNLTKLVMEMKEKLDSSTPAQISSNVQTPKPQSSFADIMKADFVSAKRRLNTAAAAPSPKPKNLPIATAGTRTGDHGLPTVEPRMNKPAKPLFDKSIHVSRIVKTVTADYFADWIANKAGIKANEDFRCTLLVKKDVDVNTLNFVSFKVDVKEAFYENMMKNDFWPQNCLFRPFVPQERQPVPVAELLMPSPSITQPNKMQKTTDPKNGESTNEATNKATNEATNATTE